MFTFINIFKNKRLTCLDNSSQMPHRYSTRTALQSSLSRARNKVIQSIGSSVLPTSPPRWEAIPRKAPGHQKGRHTSAGVSVCDQGRPQQLVTKVYPATCRALNCIGMFLHWMLVVGMLPYGHQACLVVLEVHLLFLSGCCQSQIVTPSRSQAPIRMTGN